MNFEILAPAGSMESLIAGVRSGANAIYLGGKSFNARRNAGNFDNEELKRAVEYCHSHGVKVYLTLNILVRDDEMENAYNTVRDALLCGVDAFIVQDIGVAKMIREHFQSARLHGSTQMSIMTVNGAKAAKEMGFSRIVLPRGLFGIENELKIRLEKLKKAGVNKALCGNIGSYTLCKDMGFEVYGDFGLNVFNSLSANQIDHPILSFELTQSQINNINARDKGMIVYGYLPLMLSRNCPVKNDIGCFECDKHGKLTDRKGMEFPVMCSDFPCVEMLNCHPLYMLDRLDEVKTDFIHFYFSIESKKQVEKVIALYENRGKPDFKYTRGLYQRGTL